MIRTAADVEIEKETEKEEEQIESDTFKPTGEKLGNGCWGEVSLYEDSGGQKWAIKRFKPNETARKQMRERGWTEEDVMRREAIPIYAAHRHVVPRIIERDKNGRMFIAMPVYKDNLSNQLNSLKLEDSLGITRDIADALGCIHEEIEVVREGDDYGSWDTKKRKAHGDVKPSNILMRGERAFLNDFGSSTCISIGGHGKERGVHNEENYRAPECFKEDAKPSTMADIWSLGSILYKSIAKQGIYDGIKELEGDKLQRAINRKIRKNIPWKLRGFLKRCLAVNEYDRFSTGTDALEGLEKIIENLGAKKTIKDYARKFTLPIGLPVVLAGLFVYGAATYEPQKLEMPKTNIQGMLYPTAPREESIEFEKEDVNDLPKAEDMGMFFNGLTRNAKLSTDNRIVAYLTKAHAQVQFSRGVIRSPEVYTDNQFKSYIACTTNDERQFGRLQGTPWSIWAKSIEVALNQAKTENGKVDLEDAMAISRVGIDLVNQAKRASKSFDYKDYRNAKDSKGKDIIPKAEQEFINTWLSYYYADID